MASVGPLVFAGKSVAAPVIKMIVTKAFAYLDGYFSAETMEEMKNKLEEGMMQIQAVLDVVSPDHIKDHSEALDRWFWKLRDAVEEAEDAIDELEYYELREKAKDHKVSDWGSPFAKVKHKVVKSVKHVSVLDKSVKQFTHRGTLKRLKKAMEGIDKAAAGATKFLEVVKCLKGATSSRSWQEGLMNNDRQTGSTSTVTKFVGREKEKKQIIEWLTKKIAVEEEELVISNVGIPIFSLVGHGGMGKTTLAQTICEQGDIVKDFKIIWVTVSTSFDATLVTRKMLESVNSETPKTDSLEALQQALKDKLKSVNKFLLILDDVWEEEKRNEWEKLFAPLRMGKSGSKIVLTTRMESVAAVAANVMGVERESLTLEVLQEDENLELFTHHVFSGLNSQDYYSQLKFIGEQIARKLGGCPLITKVVSGHLQGNMTPEFWDTFFHEDLNDFKGNADDIMNVLRLSYYHLPTELQTCFRYCSIFPQDYKFAKKQLVLMWISSGLIATNENEANRLEEVGEHYLLQLTRKSFFDKKIEKHIYSSLEQEYYVMHDLIHELAEYVSSGECKRISSPAKLEDVKDTVRHLSVDNIMGPYFDNAKTIVHFKNLRTLITGDTVQPFLSKHMECAINNALENSRALRLIQLNGYSPLNFPRKAGNLKHLRGVFAIEISPESIHGISKLYHLMVLKVYHLPFYHSQLDTKGVRNMANLDHLRYLSYGNFGAFPVSRLTSLRELKNFQVQGSKGNNISAIGNLRDLRELEVKGLENVNNSDEAGNAKLKEQKHLTSLSLAWSASSDAQNRIDDLVLDQLEPNANLRELYIHGTEGLRPPFWIENLTVQKLMSLRLAGCINWEHLPSLGELVFLRYLVLEKLPKLQHIGRSSHMSSSSSMEFCLPPNLYSLEVEGCHELRELPILPTSLVHLDIRHVGLTKLPKIGKVHSENVEAESSCLLKINVTNCPRLVSLERSLLEQKQYMGGLQYLDIRDCINVESVCLPFEGMNRLNILSIRNCPKMRTSRGAGETILPPSLANLSIGRCGDLELLLLGSLQCLTNLTCLRLNHCSGLVSLTSADVCNKNLKQLETLKIVGCDNLSSLGGLGSLPSLTRLCISKCCKLVEAARCSLTGYASGGKEDHLAVPKLNCLEIDLPSLLLVEPLRSLSHTGRLEIYVASEMESLPERWLLQNCKSLRYLQISKAESLPLSMKDLSSLEILTLYDAGKLQSLPDLPLSLQYLWISKCHSDLEKKIRGYGSPERGKISHVPRVKIGDWHFILGKECSEETYRDLREEDLDMLSSWANQQKDGDGVEPTLHWWNKQCWP